MKGPSFIYPSGRPIELGDEAKVIGTSTVGTVVKLSASVDTNGDRVTSVAIAPFPNGDPVEVATNQVEFVPRWVMPSMTEDNARVLRTVLLQRNDAGHGVVANLIKALDKVLGD